MHSNCLLIIDIGFLLGNPIPKPRSYFSCVCFLKKITWDMEVNSQYLLPKVNFQSVLSINPFSSTKPSSKPSPKYIFSNRTNRALAFIMFINCLLNDQYCFLHRNLIHKKKDQYCSLFFSKQNKSGRLSKFYCLPIN